jgi:hypothetical protein
VGETIPELLPNDPVEEYDGRDVAPEAWVDEEAFGSDRLADTVEAIEVPSPREVELLGAVMLELRAGGYVPVGPLVSVAFEADGYGAEVETPESRELEIPVPNGVVLDG